MQETWKPIKNYEGYYEISNLGKVKSLDRLVKQGTRYIYRRGCVKQQYISIKGYPAVTLCKNRKSTMLYIHKILAETFIPNPDNKPYIDHINTDKTDYRLENLRWVTAEENSNNQLTLQHLAKDASNKDSIQKRLISRKNNLTKTGPKTIYQYTENGEFVEKYFSIADAGRTIGCSPSYIRKILNTDKTFNHYLFTDI